MLMIYIFVTRTQQSLPFAKKFLFPIKLLWLFNAFLEIKRVHYYYKIMSNGYNRWDIRLQRIQIPVIELSMKYHKLRIPICKSLIKMCASQF